jgi:diaminohydroxyphosphoribosylaminopyrimidine deaminase/5-amino-6-(5-phosphoribosylamino)uracil reductase
MSHEYYMHRCLQLAELAKGYTAPNPMVGAVLVYQNQVIGEGYHHYRGGPHAEVNCLNSVLPAHKHLIPESTMYVSLEPCAHHGLTPPCAERLVQERVREVVIANRDPFARVDGRGIALLQAAGIAVTTNVLEAEGRWLNRRFFCAHTLKRPWVILKWAQTADGFVGTTHRQPVVISGAEAQAASHRWRTEEGAIMVGYTTALNDNPRLTPRLHNGRHPLRIVTDRQLQLPTTHHLLNEKAATWVVNERYETVAGNVHYIQVPWGQPMLPALLGRLYDAGILSLIVEGGPTLHQSFIAQGLWDEARIITATGKTLGTGLPAAHLHHMPSVTTLPMGNDVCHVYINNNAFPWVGGMEL